MRICVYSDSVSELECKADKKEKGYIFYVLRGMLISVSSCLPVLLAVQVCPPVAS